MARRIHIPHLRAGLLDLEADQLHHARRVLRLEAGEDVELFDDDGRLAPGRIRIDPGGRFQVEVVEVAEPPSADESPCVWSVASAVPKGERADWMVEKLSELGCHVFTPLITERSVVHPKGHGKHDRWVRLAMESAKQCRRRGTMQIDPPTSLADVLSRAVPAARSIERWFLDTSDSAIAIRDLLLRPEPPARLTLFIGPEGGWSEREVDQMQAHRLTGVGLTRTVLRVETASVVAAALLGTMWR